MDLLDSRGRKRKKKIELLRLISVHWGRRFRSNRELKGEEKNNNKIALVSRDAGKVH